MSGKRLSIVGLAAMYSRKKAGVYDRNAELEEEHCQRCGRSIPDRREIPDRCPSCGGVLEDFAQADFFDEANE